MMRDKAIVITKAIYEGFVAKKLSSLKWDYLFLFWELELIMTFFNAFAQYISNGHFASISQMSRELMISNHL